MAGPVTYPTVRDYIDEYPAHEDPHTNLGPWSPDERIMFLRKVSSVFASATLSKVVHDIRAAKSSEAPSPFKGGHRVFYINGGQPEIFEVVFDAEGKVQKELIDNTCYKTQTAAIQEIAITIIERLGDELNWKGTRQRIAFSAVEYQFSRATEEPLDWHEDNLYEFSAHSFIPSSYSFITLLSDPADSVTGWTGGDFLYTGKRSFEKSVFHEELERTKCAVLNDPHSPTWKIRPSLNDGILFGNKGMNHKITAPIPLSETGSRMIFTIFSFPEITS